MSLGRRSPSLALSAALTLGVVPASAEPDASGRSPASAAPTPLAAEAGARDALHRAGEARRAGRFAEAVEAYRAALADHHGPKPSPAKRAEVLGELGLCELALGDHRDAAEHLHLSLEHRSALSIEQQMRFEAAQKQAEREVGTLFLAVSPRDAEVLLDGEPLGAPRPTHVVFVEPGPHTIRARLSDHADAVAAIQAVRGASTSVTLTLLARTATPVPSPEATGASTAPAPANGAGATPRTLRTIALGTAISGVIVGVGFWVAAGVLDGVVEERAASLRARGGSGACNGTEFPSACKHQEFLIARRDSVGAAAVAVLIASGALGALSVSSYWWAPDTPLRATIRVEPVAAGALSPSVTFQTVW
ncbi:PEGA domain-containing protein [Sorangium sp. So ce281]|uniref:PEGA domain-containing protein n=1 Tax=unclassified Sorangium TaxID=2621164 RepID=UPI003F614A18